MSENLDILIPHYRDPFGLSQSLKSISEQTWQGEMRVVVVDDGSPETDFLEVEKICAKFSQIGVASVTLARNPQNLGRPKTRNKLLDLVEAKYVAWLDAGDVWYPRKLEVQFDHLSKIMHSGKNIDSVWVTCAYDWHQAGSNKPKRIRQFSGGDQIKELLVGTRLRAYLWTLLGTANSFHIAGRFDDRLHRMQDLDYFLNFIRGGGEIVTPDAIEAQCCYFKSDIGRNAEEVHRCYDLILIKHRPVILRYPAAFRSELNYKVKRLAARFARSNGDNLLSLKYMAETIFVSPRHLSRVIKNKISQKLRGVRK